MGWLTTLIQFIPALVSLIPQILALIQAINNAINHKQIAAGALAAGSPLPEWMWYAYVPGQALAGTAVTALLMAALQPRMNAMARAYREVQEADEAARDLIIANRTQTAKALRLKASLAALSPEHQQIVTK